MRWNRLLQPPSLSALDCGTECGRCGRKGCGVYDGPSKQCWPEDSSRAALWKSWPGTLHGLSWYVKREGLAILDNVCTHIQSHYNIHAPLSSAVRRELFRIMSVLPLLRVHTRAAWHDRLTMSDASPFGIGVVDRQVEGEAIDVILVAAWRNGASTPSRLSRRDALRFEQVLTPAITSSSRSMLLNYVAPSAHSLRSPRTCCRRRR